MGCHYSKWPRGHYPHAQNKTVLTPRQLEAFNFIAAFIQERGQAPMLKDIAEGLGLNGEFLAWRFVKILIDKGYLAKEPRQRQSLRIVKHPEGSAHAVSPREQAAYARGVNAGRASVASTNAGLEAEALKREYARGVRDGREAMRKELTYLAKHDTKPLVSPPETGSSLLPFLRRSD